MAIGFLLHEQRGEGSQRELVAIVGCSRFRWWFLGDTGGCFPWPLSPGGWIGVGAGAADVDCRRTLTAVQGPATTGFRYPNTLRRILLSPCPMRP